MIEPELIEDEPSVNSRTLRQFAALWLLFVGGLAAWNLFDGDRRDAIVFSAVAIAVAAPGLLWPRAIRPLFLLLIGVATPIGMVMTRVILGAIFYLLFAPIGFLFKLLGRDVLMRKRNLARETYWTRRTPQVDPRRYFRQF